MKRLLNNIPGIVCYFALGTLLVMTVYFVLSFRNSSYGNTTTGESIGFEDGWTLEDGTNITRLSRLNNLSDDTAITERSIYAVLPDAMPKGSTLCFSITHLYLSVYIDGINVYNQNVPESRLYTNSAGPSWIFIPLDSTDSGKVVEIRFRTCYENDPCGITNMSISVGYDIVIQLIKNKGFNFIFSIIFLVLAILLIIGDLFVSARSNKKHSFLYLGLITLTVAMYILAESQILQLFISNTRLIHFLSCFSLLLFPMPIILYTNSAFTFRMKNTLKIFSIVYFVVFLTVIALNFSDVADYHDMLFVSHFMSIFAISVMIISIIRYVYTSVKEKKSELKYIILEPAGLILLIITGLIDLCRYYFFFTSDPAKFLRIGLLGFIILFGISNCQKYVNSCVLNARAKARAEFISNLAYHDGLTGLSNRTAYNEKIKELINCGQKVGICIFDVNDLKKTNDSMGHHFGDLLLQQSSKILDEAFGAYGICYRIGGDEFVAIVQDDDSDKIILSSIDRLKELMNKHNESDTDPFKISIAAGYSIYCGVGDLKKVIKSADMMMYENKRKMKAAMNI